MDDELLDIVDVNENVIGTINRKDSDLLKQKKSGFIRVADMFIMNDEGNIWVPIRGAHKKIAPNGYDFSVGGHVMSGDNYVQTLIRETKEEADLDITEADVVFIAKVVYEESRFIQNLYLLRSNKTPTFSPDEFVGAQWLEPSELVKNINNGHPAKSNIKHCITLLEAYLLQNH